MTLAGDAAHSMLPRKSVHSHAIKPEVTELTMPCAERGQGLNNAIKDASDIVDSIVAAMNGQKTFKDAITEYEAEMKPRGAKEVALSLEQALKARKTDTLKDSPIFKQGWKRDDAEVVEAPTAEKA